MSHEEEVPRAGGLEPICGYFTVASRKNDLQVGKLIKNL